MQHPALHRRALLSGGLAIGSAAVLGGWRVSPAASAVSQPVVAGCSTWGAQAARGAIEVLQQRPTMVVIHHTASANTTDTSVARAYSLSRSVQQWHFDRGWVDTGQQFTNSRGGHVTEGRHGSLSALQGGRSHVVGAHVSGQNSVALGIENEGTYTSVRPPQALYDSLVRLVAYMCQQYAIPTGSIYGHRDFNATECPGEMLYAMLPQLRSDVAGRLSGTQPPPTRVWPTLRTGSTGEQVRTAQLLLNSSGASLVADGQFGTGTQTATERFQAARGLTADGVIGTRTWEALATPQAAGARGPAVEAVQRQLNLRGARLSVDGVFGPGTTSAVRNFQSAQGLSVDGEVGLNTWSRLLMADSTVVDRTWAPRTTMR